MSITVSNFRRATLPLRASPSAELGTLFKEARSKSWLSREQVVSHIVGLSTGTLELYENGTLGIPLDDVFALANTLNISPASIQRLLLRKGSSFSG